MKNFRSIMLFSVCALALNACQKEDTLASAAKDTDGAATSKEAILSWKDCADFVNYDMSVCFADANEYRCPCDVDCVWAGSVEYTLKVKTADQESLVVLQPPGNPQNAPSSAVVGKAKISIQETRVVNCADYGNYEKYRLTVTITDADDTTLGTPRPAPAATYLGKAVVQGN
ncbi:MAG: hypothetical protein JNM22_16610 [Saprospiraceae bacterium]|nr:hypothetical protein [Saprospiraceae bacterium]